ncbi:MAG: RagB/SusD family nutrient uptake outer membrane protein [Paludibacter sp.]|nr:RagB/SusD family nutrient uptake outer membrane protein [Paludibacter sp.]
MKIYKKIKIAILVIALIPGLNSCEFLIQEPVSDLTSESFWKSQTDAEVGVAAIYSSMSAALSRGLWDWGELRGDSYEPHEKEAYDQGELIYNNILNDNSATLWTQLYQVIGQANSALKYIPGITMTPSVKNQLMAEAYTLRAWAYFYAVRVWGDVPLFIEPVEEIGPGMYRERTDKDYILENVILVDLEKAYLLIDRTSVKRTRVNVATICALLMDVNAWMHRYERVITIMNERANLLRSTDWNLITTTANTFKSDWRGIFIEDPVLPVSPEVLFKLSYETLGNGINNAVSYFASSQPKVWLSSYVKNSLYNLSDLRYGATQWENVDSQHSKLNRKFWYNNTVFTGTTGRDVDLVVYRYADIVLLYAEALAMTDNFSDAVFQLNKITTRAGNSQYFTADFVSQEELIDAILLERHREFLGEGKRWFDLVRCNRFDLLKERNNVEIRPTQIYFPIHRDHINQNPLLEQNPY